MNFEKYNFIKNKGVEDPLMSINYLLNLTDEELKEYRQIQQYERVRKKYNQTKEDRNKKCFN